MRFFSRDTQQQAMSFLIQQTSYIEPVVYKIRYPDIIYQDVVPVDTSANEWAKSITFFSTDMVGRADWFHSTANDIPLADITREKFEQGIEMAGIGYRYNLEELGQAMMIPNMNLSTDRADAARRAYEEFVQSIAFFGDTRKTWTGIMNNTAVPIINVSGGTWLSKSGSVSTVNSILTDLNGALSNIWQASNTVEMADTILLPLAISTLLSMTQLPNTTMNLLEWIKKNNVYTQETGQPLVIRGLRGLDTASETGGPRALVYRRAPDVVKMHIPMPHRFLPVWQRGPLTFDVPGIFRLGGVEIRRPGAFRYLEGI